MNSFLIRRPLLHCALFVLLLSALLLPAAHAQTGLYGQVSGTHFNLPNTNSWGAGGGFGLYSDFFKIPHAKIGGDIRFQYTRPASETNLFSTLLGPRIAVHPRGDLTPYAEFLFGPGHFTYGNNSPSTTQFDWRALGGVDKKLLPRLDWRVIEVSYGQINTYSGRMHLLTLSTAIVLRLH